MKVKICGLFRDIDIDYVNRVKPDYIGFVFAKKKRLVSAEQAKQLKAKLNSDITAVGVFINKDIDTLESLVKNNIIDIIQLHGDEDNAFIAALRQRVSCPIWKAFTIRSDEDIKRANLSDADMLVLDNGHGTGETFDWNLLKNINRPYFLAGGINCDNLEQAIALAPYGIDCSSGAETDGVKDFEKIKFIVGRIKNE